MHACLPVCLSIFYLSIFYTARERGASEAREMMEGDERERASRASELASELESERGGE
ncbi:hypothetical protein DPMN_100302 [Dreissena polymorpha]|uniref:Uncharacterized protein n=1 Tax=Dreissena polymorpha TaxID=45954 RepID=A0A9D4LFP5_DREPO|nr:hypothetical protein DPMN_100302 [Dreissena polymorpha]